MKVVAAVLALTTVLIPVASPAAAQTGAQLTVSSGATGIDVPGDAPMMLLRQSFVELLKQRGLTLESWMNACRGNAPFVRASDAGRVAGAGGCDPHARDAGLGP